MRIAMYKVAHSRIWMPPFLVALSFSIILINPVAAEVYKWIDEDGKVHYGDRPDNNSAEEIKLKKAPERDTGLAERRETQKKMLDIYQEERVEKQEQLTKLKEEQELRKANCQTARKTLAKIKSVRYLFKKEENGERRIFSDDERTAAEQKVAMQVERWCD
jgi:hypothetical protein